MYNTIMAIDDIMFDTESAVLESMYESYEKAYMILENYNGTDVEALQLFQEAKTDKNTNDEKFQFRQIDEKTGQKESILRSLWKLIPRLIEHIRKLIAKRKAAKQTPESEIAKAIGTLNTVIKDNSPNTNKTKKELKKEYLKNYKAQKEALKAFKRHEFFKKLGIKLVAGSVVACGGYVFYTGEGGNIVKQKVNEFKGKIDKKIDDKFAAQIQRIDASCENAVEKIKSVADKIIATMDRAVQFIKKLFACVQKFFKVKIGGFNEVDGDGDIICKVDIDTKSITCNLDFDVWAQWIKECNASIKHSLTKLGAKIDDNGKIVKDENADKSKSAINQHNKEYESKTVIGKLFMPSTEELIKNIQKHSMKLSESKKLKSWSIEKFVYKSKKLTTDTEELVSIAGKLSQAYSNRINRLEQKEADKYNDSKAQAIDKQIREMLQGILTSAENFLVALDSIDTYIDSVVEYSKIFDEAEATVEKKIAAKKAKEATEENKEENKEEEQKDD